VAAADTAALGSEGDRDNYNDDLTAIVTEADIYTSNPAATLRVADRFVVNAAGKIVDQENHFDPRDVTNPGWRHG